MLLTVSYLGVCLWLRFKVWWHRMRYINLIKNNIHRSSLVFRKLGQVSTLLNLQLEKEAKEEYATTEWKEELLVLEARHQMMSVTPQVHIDLTQWTSYLDKQEIDLTSSRNKNTCHLILKVMQPEDTEEFMKRSFSVQINGKIKVLDYVIPLAWHSGQPFSIAAESTIDGLAHLAVAFMEGSLIVLDDLLELTEMASVTLDGRASKLLQTDSVMRLLSGISSPGSQTSLSILSSIGDSYNTWGDSNESMATESDFNDADSMLSAHDMSYDSDVAPTSTPNNSIVCSDAIEGTANTQYMSANSSEQSKDFSWGENSVENKHTVGTASPQAVNTLAVSPKVVHESSWDSQQSTGKPPNVLVYCGQKDSSRQFEAVKEIIGRCLNSSRYAIYHLRHGDVHTVPWPDNTRLLIISSEHVYDGVDEVFLKYFHQGGAIVSFTSAFDTLFVQRLQNRSITGILQMAFEQWTNVTTICGIYTYNTTGGSCLLPGVDVQIVATDTKTSSPIMLQVLDENSDGVAFLSQVNLEKHPAEMAISPEILAALKDTTPERLKILTRIFSALGMDVSQGEPLTTTPCFLFAVSQAQKEKLLKSAVARLQDGILHSRKMSLHFVEDSSMLTKDRSPGNVTPLLTSPGSDVACTFDLQEYSTWLDTQVLGQVVIYADVAETTMAFIDGMMSCTPKNVGVVAVAGRQTKGHGRGGNVWLSPSGCAMFSVHVRIAVKSRLGQRLAYLQHISALAVIEAVLAQPDCQDIDLRVKWPNDIYFGKTMKIGGVIVNSSIIGEQIDANVGCGVNVTNSDPTLCINDLLTQYNSSHDTSLQPLKVEQLIGLSISKMEQLINLFQTHGKEAFLEVYYSRWLHMNQTICLHSEDGPVARVVGLDDHGYLLVEETDGSLTSVQPDGNSFDMMRNLVSHKR